MKLRKIFLFLVSAALSVALFTGCPGNVSGAEGSETQNDTLKDYKFNISHLPHDSEGLNVVIRAIFDKKTYEKDLGKIENYTADTCVEGTVQLPSTHDELTLLLVDKTEGKNEIKYLTEISERRFDQESNTYKITGYYYFKQESKSLIKKYVGINEKMFKALELDSEYDFNYYKTPFLLFYAEGLLGKKIAASVQENKSKYMEDGIEKERNKTFTDVYISSDINKIMSYDVTYSDLLSKYGTECQSDKVYIMVKPMFYDFDIEEEEALAKVKFTRILQDNEKCLTIDKSVFASDGMLYASGTYIDEKAFDKLYQINPKTNERILFAEVDGKITGIFESVSGTLLVSYDMTEEDGNEKTDVCKIDMSSAVVSPLTNGMDLECKEIIGFKDNKCLMFGRWTNEIHGIETVAYLLDFETGTFKKLKDKCLWSLQGINEGFYVPEYDMIVYSGSSSAHEICFLRVDETDEENPLVYGYNSGLFYDYDKNYPHKLYNTNPLEIITADGDIFTINVALIDSVEPIDDYDEDNDLIITNYFKKIEGWCQWSRNINKTYTDFIANGDFFYIMKVTPNEEMPTIYKDTTVEKYSFSAPDTLIDSVTIEKEEGLKLWKNNNEVYLQATYWKYLRGESSYSIDSDMISFHEIDF